MAFTGQVFSVGQVLTAAQMNQQDENIDEVRRDHKGTTAPPELTAGVTWLDDSNPEWMLKQFDGVDQIAKGWFDTSQNQFTASVMGQFKNKLINPNFDLAQRGNSFQLTNTGAYTLDRWNNATGNSGQATITQQSFTLGQTVVPNEPEFFMRHSQNSGGNTNPQIIQRMEGVRTFAGQQITLSLFGRSNSGSITITPRMIQNFGTGGSPSVSVVNTSQNISATGSLQTFTVTFSLASISGKTLGTSDNDYLQFDLLFPTGTTFSFDLAQVQIERGPIATPFELRHIGQERALCQRYFYEPLDSTGNSEIIVTGALNQTSGIAGARFVFPTQMRSPPSVINPPTDANYGVTYDFARTGITAVNKTGTLSITLAGGGLGEFFIDFSGVTYSSPWNAYRNLGANRIQFNAEL